MHEEAGKSPCRNIYDSEDSFPTGAIRKTGRVFCRPDLINVQRLDGVLYNVKYLIIARNVTVSPLLLLYLLNLYAILTRQNTLFIARILPYQLYEGISFLKLIRNYELWNTH